MREGSDLLAGRTVVVAGGTGAVGRVAVGAFLDAGARVVVPSRSPGKLEGLAEAVGAPSSDRLVTLAGDLSDERDGARLTGEIEERAGEVHGVVATLGGFVPAPSVLEASKAELRRAVDGYLVAHFMVAKALLPMVDRPGGSYTFINGPLAFEPLFPGTGLVSIATAGQAMLARMVMEEWSERAVRINELVIHTRFGGGEDDGKGPVSQGDVGRFLAYLASDRGSSTRGQTIHLDRAEPLRELAGAPAG